jgi:hypothetical protein
MTELRRNPHDFHGEQWTNHTDQSATDPDSRLFKKAKGCEATLACLSGALMANIRIAWSSTLCRARGRRQRARSDESRRSLPSRRFSVGATKADNLGSVDTPARVVLKEQRARWTGA